jgi:transcriptional regulator with XRE-family HTH domain
MKEKDAYIENKDHPVVLYTEKDDNTYGPIISGAVSSKDYIDDFRAKFKHLEDAILTKVRSGETSMIYYYMMLQELTPSELANRIGISKSKVERHFQTKHFEKASVETIRKYAEVFNVPVANLFQLILTKEDNLWKAHHVDNEVIIDNHCISQHKTDNPLIVVTTIEERKS